MAGLVSRLNIVSWFSFLWNQRTFPFSISKWYCPSLCFEWPPTVSNIDCMPLFVSSLTHVDIVIPSLGILSKCAPSRRTSPPWKIEWCWKPKFNKGSRIISNADLKSLKTALFLWGSVFVCWSEHSISRNGSPRVHNLKRASWKRNRCITTLVNSCGKILRTIKVQFLSIKCSLMHCVFSETAYPLPY